MIIALSEFVAAEILLEFVAVEVFAEVLLEFELFLHATKWTRPTKPN